MSRSRGRLLGRYRAVVAFVPILAGTLPPPASAQQTAAPQTAPAGPLVFEGVTVVDVERGQLLAGQRVVILGNRIQAVGSTRTVAWPKGARVVAARGKYLIPGLWDLHIHPRGFTRLVYPLSVAAGVTGIRDAGSQVDAPLDSLVQWRREILAGTRVGPPRQLLSVQYSFGMPDTAVLSPKARGVTFIEFTPFDERAVAMVRRVGLPFDGPVNWGMSAVDASDSGLRILEHHRALDGKSDGGLDTLCLAWQDPSIGRARNRARTRTGSVERCRPLAERFRRNGTWWVPTLVVQGDGGARARALSERFAARASMFWSDTVLNPFVPGYRGGEPLVSARWATAVPDPAGLLAIAQQVDLPIVAGTDVVGWASTLYVAPAGFALHAALASYVAEGLTPLAALQSATLNPAKLLQATDSLGTIAPGKLADLVLLDANPLADIANTTAIRAVVANGRYYDRAALNRLLAEVKATHLYEANHP